MNEWNQWRKRNEKRRNMESYSKLRKINYSSVGQGVSMCVCVCGVLAYCCWVVGGESHRHTRTFNLYNGQQSKRSVLNTNGCTSNLGYYYSRVTAERGMINRTIANKRKKMNMTKKKYQPTSLQAMCAEGNNDNNCSNNDNITLTFSKCMSRPCIILLFFFFILSFTITQNSCSSKRLRNPPLNHDDILSAVIDMKTFWFNFQRETFSLRTNLHV